MGPPVSRDEHCIDIILTKAEEQSINTKILKNQ